MVKGVRSISDFCTSKYNIWNGKKYDFKFVYERKLSAGIDKELFMAMVAYGSNDRIVRLSKM